MTIKEIDHEITGIKAKLKWEHLTNRAQLEERLQALLEKRRKVLEGEG